jgi:hypothetical protein
MRKGFSLKTIFVGSLLTLAVVSILTINAEAKTGSQLLNETNEYLATHDLYEDGLCLDVTTGEMCDTGEYLEVLAVNDNLKGIAGHKSFLKKAFDTAYSPVKSVGHAVGIEGHKSITICGTKIVIPVLMYAACLISADTLPAQCTAGSISTMGASCAAQIAIVAGSCGVSIAAIGTIAQRCIDRI